MKNREEEVNKGERKEETRGKEGENEGKKRKERRRRRFPVVVR